MTSASVLKEAQEVARYLKVSIMVSLKIIGLFSFMYTTESVILDTGPNNDDKSRSHLS